jgi:hypothetical protein
MRNPYWLLLVYIVAAWALLFVAFSWVIDTVTR